ASAANFCCPFILCSPVDGAVLSNSSIISNYHCGFFTHKFQILRNCSYAGTGEYLAVFAYSGPGTNKCIGVYMCAITNGNIIFNYHKRIDDYIIPYLCIWMYMCKGTYHT